MSVKHLTSALKVHKWEIINKLQIWFISQCSTRCWFTIHFHKQLIQCVLLFTVAAETSSATFPTHGVDLVDKQNARRILPSHRKHITNLTARTALKCAVTDHTIWHSVVRKCTKNKKKLYKHNTQLLHRWTCVNQHTPIRTAGLCARAVPSILFVFYLAPKSGQSALFVFSQIVEPEISRIRIISTTGSARP